MAKRTENLPPLTGLPRLIRDLRYHEASRQAGAILLVVLFAVVADPTRWSVWIGAPVALLGTIVRLYASGFISKNHELATEGPYALVRHPLYSGNILIVSAFALMAGRIWAPPLAAAFFWFYYPPTIAYEDDKLHRLFGQRWREWAARTPALAPRPANLAGFKLGRWSLLRSMKRNGEPVIAAIVLASLVGVGRALG
jgi:protein-S-isoprenylcysteine O-methyltransferase Ste14